MGRGEYLLAFDLSSDGLQQHAEDIELQYLLVLALARAEATDQALSALSSFDLEARVASASLALQEDVAALRARLAKDRALRVGGEAHRSRAREAAELYELIYRRLGRSYSCINAATMWLVAGEARRSADLAHAAWVLCEQAISDDPMDVYWRAATQAEAALLLGDAGAAAEALKQAAACAVEIASVATTRRQLLLVAERKDIDPAVIDALPVSSVIHYGGHMIASAEEGARFGPEALPQIRDEIAAYLDGHDVGYGFGSLACGADLLFAEALLARGAELHVVLPFDAEEFKAVSVTRGGDGWQERFDHCHAQARSVSYATQGAYLGDDSLFDYCACLAMGHAVIRATFLTAPVEQVVVWDGRPAEGGAGTGADVETWRRSGRRTHVIGVEPGRAKPSSAPAPPSSGRVLRAMLFADVKGFSTLTDSQMETFLSTVMLPLATTLDRFESSILHRNSWGDGLYVVLRDVTAAAQCALALQEAMRTLDAPAVGLPATLGLRIGAHLGPVFEAQDPVRRERNFYGVEVTRTARIEPRTPEGEVYVTDPFAALIALEEPKDLSCQYVGHIPTAKDYGTFPMYVLKRRT